MDKWEYAVLSLFFAGAEKSVSVTQYCQPNNISLEKGKGFLKNNHFDVFKQIPARLGVDGWEMVSISTLTGSDQRTGVISSVEGFEVMTTGQEFWFKRKLADNKLPTIAESLQGVFI